VVNLAEILGKRLQQCRTKGAVMLRQNFAANQNVVYRDFAITFSEPSAEQILRQISRQIDNYLVVNFEIFLDIY
jgi:hypothetical protein